MQQIAQDILTSQATAARLHPEEAKLDRERRSLDWPGRHRRYEVKEELAKADKDMEIARSELRDLGLVVLDELEGRIGFPTMVNNRRAYFSWHPGEEGLNTWRFADEDVDRQIPPTWLKELALASKA